MLTDFPHKNNNQNINYYEKWFVSTYIDDIVRCVEVIQIDKYTENDVLCLIKELKDQPEKYIQALAIPDVSHGS